MGSLCCWLVKQWTGRHQWFAEFYWFSISIQTNLRSSPDTSGSPPQFMVPLFVGSLPYRSPMRQGGCLVAWVAGADSQRLRRERKWPCSKRQRIRCSRCSWAWSISNWVISGWSFWRLYIISFRLDGVGWQSICVQGFVLSLLVKRTDSRSKTERIVIIRQRHTPSDSEPGMHSHIWCAAEARKFTVAAELLFNRNNRNSWDLRKSK